MLDMPVIRIREGVPVGHRRYHLPLGLTLLIWLLLIVPAVGAVALGFPPLLAPALWIALSVNITAIARAQIALAHIRAEQLALTEQSPAPSEIEAAAEFPDPAARDTAWDDAEAELNELRAQLIERGRTVVWSGHSIPNALHQDLLAANVKVELAKSRRTIARDYWDTHVVPAERAREEVYLAIGEHIFGTTLVACAALPALKRPFRLITDCQHGHVGEHLVTTAPTRDRVGRACYVDGCASTWTEWA